MAVLAAPVLGGLTTVGGAIAAGATVAAGVVQARGAARAEEAALRAQEQQALFQAQVAENNALIEEQNREQAIANAALQAQDQDIGARTELGALIAEQGASGLDLGSGSFLRVREGLESIASQDRERIIEGGRIEAAGAAQRAADFRTQAAGARATATDARNAQSVARRTGRTGVFTSLISGASTIAGSTARSITGQRTNPVSQSLRPRLRPQLVS